jgi:hypothetical protein
VNAPYVYEFAAMPVSFRAKRISQNRPRAVTQRLHPCGEQADTFQLGGDSENLDETAIR